MKKKKVGTLVISCLLVLVTVFFMTACDEAKSVDNNNNTGNVIFGGERPDYDAEFDYESGYVPQEQFDPEKIITLTMDDASVVKFALGANTLSVKTQTELTENDFDLSGIKDDRKLGGVAYMKSDGTYNSAQSLDSFRVPNNDTTINTYFNPREGFTWLDIGSGVSGKFNYSYVPGSISENRTISYSDGRIISGGKDGYPERGVIITESSKITADSAIRMDTKYAVAAGTAYEFMYNFENKGTNAIQLNGYQIAASSEYRGQKGYESRYRMDIDLQPGESTSITAQYTLGSDNSNALTYFVADADMENMVLGMSMSVRAIEPEIISPTEKYTLTLDNDADVTFADGSKAIEITVGSDMPAFINNNPDTDIAGWYDINDTNIFWKQTPYVLRDSVFGSSSPVSVFTMPGRNLSIAPFYVEEGMRSLIPASQTIDNNNASAARAGTKFFETDIGTQIGAEINYSGTSGNRFRLVSSCGASSSATGAIAAGKHSFFFWFTNLGGEEIKFQTYQVSTNRDLIDGANTDVITLAPGESCSASIDNVTLAANANALTLIYLRQTQANAKLGIVISKNPAGHVV